MVLSKAWTYTVTAGPDALAVTLDDFKLWAKTSAADSDAFLTSILEAAILFGEQYTKRDFITKTYQTWRDDLSEVCELRRSKLQSVTHIKYLVSGVQVTVSSDLYYNTVETDFSRILLVDGESWPTDGDVREQSVEIQFDAGYGDAATDVPQELQQAILQHATLMLENRGDCPESSLPLSAAAIYQKYRIQDIVLARL